MENVDSIEQPNQSHPWKPKIHDPRSTGHRTNPKKSFFFKSEEDFFNVIHILSIFLRRRLSTLNSGDKIQECPILHSISKTKFCSKNNIVHKFPFFYLNYKINSQKYGRKERKLKKRYQKLQTNI